MIKWLRPMRTNLEALGDYEKINENLLFGFGRINEKKYPKSLKTKFYPVYSDISINSWRGVGILVLSVFGQILTFMFADQPLLLVLTIFFISGILLGIIFAKVGDSVLFLFSSIAGKFTCEYLEGGVKYFLFDIDFLELQFVVNIDGVLNDMRIVGIDVKFNFMNKDLGKIESLFEENSFSFEKETSYRILVESDV